MKYPLRLYKFLNETKHQILYSFFGTKITCKHNPSCSKYLENQIKERGTIIGLWRSIGRILTCW